MTDRKLASIQRILDIQPIDGADKIVLAKVKGWDVVTAIDNGFKVGDLVCYIEIDSWVPNTIAPFLSKGKEPRMFEGVLGERLRTIRLRGQYSQGLILPLKVLDAENYWRCFIPPNYWTKGEFRVNHEEGADCTEFLGIIKYEKPIPAQLAGLCKGNFPSFLRKTDQERVQNLQSEINLAYISDQEFEVTEKVDGSSMTVYYFEFESDNNGPIDIQYGVCSRNLDLKMDQEGNAFVDTAKNTNLIDALVKYRRNLAIQGELCGGNIQKNKYNIPVKFLVFDIFDIDNYTYVSPSERYRILDELQELGANIGHVPVIDHFFTLVSGKIQDLLDKAEGPSIINYQTKREGLVFKSHNDNFSFKAIANSWLLENE